MIGPIPQDYRGQVIELGPGTGVLTARLAKRCPNARILACEINRDLARNCRRHLTSTGVGRRVKVVCDSAENLLSEMVRTGVEAPDFVLSGIPLANIPRGKVAELVTAIHRCLKKGGMYIQFQYSLIDRKTIRSIFPRVRTVPAFLNFPPAFVYFAQK
jgi:phospholipid N-methyltransferase